MRDERCRECTALTAGACWRHTTLGNSDPKPAAEATPNELLETPKLVVPLSAEEWLKTYRPRMIHEIDAESIRWADEDLFAAFHAAEAYWRDQCDNAAMAEHAAVEQIDALKARAEAAEFHVKDTDQERLRVCNERDQALAEADRWKGEYQSADGFRKIAEGERDEAKASRLRIEDHWRAACRAGEEIAEERDSALARVAELEGALTDAVKTIYAGDLDSILPLYDRLVAALSTPTPDGLGDSTDSAARAEQGKQALTRMRAKWKAAGMREASATLDQHMCDGTEVAGWAEHDSPAARAYRAIRAAASQLEDKGGD